MTDSTNSDSPFDLKSEVRRAVASLEQKTTGSASSTSDLSIDEELNLHSIGWEQVELVGGVSVFSVPAGLWNWGQGEILGASSAHAQAFSHAISRIHKEAASAGGHGVVGVRIERSVHPSHVEVSLLGTAVRPIGAPPVKPEEVFVSDLSARDFALLMVAGWEPLGLACGASFVYAPRRQMSAVLQQSSQNIELTNFTEAMYASRESAMERMQRMAIALKGTGVVQVNVVEGPMPFATHAVGFAAWGTVVRLVKESHQLLHPQMVFSMNDAVVAFDAEALA